MIHGKKSLGVLVVVQLPYEHEVEGSMSATTNSKLFRTFYVAGFGRDSAQLVLGIKYC